MNLMREFKTIGVYTAIQSDEITSIRHISAENNLQTIIISKKPLLMLELKSVILKNRIKMSF